MTVRMPMDQDLYDAAVKVLDTIEDKLIKSPRSLTDEEVLGRSTAEAYRSWRALLVSKYLADNAEPSTPRQEARKRFLARADAAGAPPTSILAAGPFPDPEPNKPKLDGRRHNRPAKPTKGHPWRTAAKKA